MHTLEQQTAAQPTILEDKVTIDAMTRNTRIEARADETVVIKEQS